MTTLQNARVLITGGSRGLGRAMVEAFLARGAEAMAIARTRRGLEEVERLGAKVLAGDATDSTFMDRIVTDFDPSVLILNAGARLVMQPIDKLSFEEFSVNWNTDVKAALHGVQAAIKAPMKPGSRVLLMSSGVAMDESSPDSATERAAFRRGHRRKAHGLVHGALSQPSSAAASLPLMPSQRDSRSRTT